MKVYDVGNLMVGNQGSLPEEVIFKLRPEGYLRISIVKVWQRGGYRK